MVNENVVKDCHLVSAVGEMIFAQIDSVPVSLTKTRRNHHFYTDDATTAGG